MHFSNKVHWTYAEKKRVKMFCSNNDIGFQLFWLFYAKMFDAKVDILQLKWSQ